MNSDFSHRVLHRRGNLPWGIACLLLVYFAFGMPGGDVTVAQDSLEAELASRVRGLVRQLNETQLSRREAAERALAEMGPEVLPLLPPVTDRTPAEMAQRLARIRQVLQRRAAEAAVEASRVTLSGPLSLEEALATLSEQSGNRLIDRRRSLSQQVTNPQVNPPVDDLPFWQALDALLDEAGLTLYPYAGEAGELAIASRQEGERPRTERASYSGPFRIEATGIDASRDLRNLENRSLRLSLEVAWEPRLSPIQLRQPLADLRVIDDRGESLGVVGAAGEVETPLQGRFSTVNFTLPLELPDREVHSIAELRGRLFVLVPGRVERFEFGQLVGARDVQQPRGGVVVTLQLARKNVDTQEVRVRVRFDQAGGALQSHLRWIYRNKAVLLNHAGEELAPAAMDPTGEGANEVGISYKFAIPEDSLAGYTFVYETPGALLEVPVPFVLKEIPLP